MHNIMPCAGPQYDPIGARETHSVRVKTAGRYYQLVFPHNVVVQQWYRAPAASAPVGGSQAVQTTQNKAYLEHISRSLPYVTDSHSERLKNQAWCLLEGSKTWVDLVDSQMKGDKDIARAIEAKHKALDAAIEQGHVVLSETAKKEFLAQMMAQVKKEYQQMPIETRRLLTSLHILMYRSGYQVTRNDVKTMLSEAQKTLSIATQNSQVPQNGELNIPQNVSNNTDNTAKKITIIDASSVEHLFQDDHYKKKLASCAAPVVQARIEGKCDVRMAQARFEAKNARVLTNEQLHAHKCEIERHFNEIPPAERAANLPRAMQMEPWRYGLTYQQVGKMREKPPNVESLKTKRTSCPRYVPYTAGGKGSDEAELPLELVGVTDAELGQRFAHFLEEQKCIETRDEHGRRVLQTLQEINAQLPEDQQILPAEVIRIMQYVQTLGDHSTLPVFLVKNSVPDLKHSVLIYNEPDRCGPTVLIKPLLKNGSKHPNLQVGTSKYVKTSGVQLHFDAAQGSVNIQRVVTVSRQPDLPKGRDAIIKNSHLEQSLGQQLVEQGFSKITYTDPLHNGRTLFVKPYLGENLLQWRGKLDDETKFDIAEQLLNQFNWDIGDIKPQNTLWDGKVASFIDTTQMAFTCTTRFDQELRGRFVGQPPEKIRRQQIFGLSCLLYALFNDKPEQKLSGHYYISHSKPEMLPIDETLPFARLVNLAYSHAEKPEILLEALKKERKERWEALLKKQLNLFISL